MSYAVPKQFQQIELEIKKSRFIAWADRVGDRREAMAFLARARAQYSDARHHCWAYQIGPPHSPITAAMSDDGEPSGTAGKPILNVLQHKDVGNVMVIVSRYFGGIKLGAGGLVRAYSAATENVMRALKTECWIQHVEKTVIIDFSKEQQVRHWLSQHNGSVLDAAYGEQVRLSVSIAASDTAALDILLDSL